MLSSTTHLWYRRPEGLIVLSKMSGCGYTLIDFSYPRHHDAGLDNIVRLMEYIRRHLRELAPAVPANSDIDLIASGSAHNVGPRPILGLHSQPGAGARAGTR
jgi:hypothetical protein